MEESSHFIGTFCEIDAWRSFGKNVTELPFVSYTPCFEDAGLMGIVRLSLILFSCRRLVLLVGDKRKLQLYRRAPQVVRLILVVVLMLVPIVQLGGRLAQGEELIIGVLPPVAPFEIVGFVLEFAAWALVGAVLALELLGYSRDGAWYLRFCFVFAFLTNSIKLRFIYHVVQQVQFFYVLFFVSYCCLGLLVMTSIARPALVTPEGLAAPLLEDAEPPGCCFEENAAGVMAGQPNTEASVGLFSQFTFEWVTPLLKVGYKRPLLESDLFRLAQSDYSRTLTYLLQETWAEEVDAQRERASLKRVLARAWFWPFLTSGVWKVLNDLQQFSGPMFMGLLLKALADVAKDDTDTQAVGRAYACTAGIFCMHVAGAVGEGQYFQGSMRCGMQVRSALMSTMFAKSLRLSSASRQKLGTGRLNNMLSSDCEAMQQLVNQLHMLWSAPLRIVLAMGFLSLQVGYATVTGTLLICLAVPLQNVIMSRMGVRMRASTKATDERVRLSNETFGAIQLVKLYAWEAFCTKAINVARKEELDKILSFANLRAISTFVVTGIPVLVSTATFATFCLLYGSEALTPAIAFTTLSLLSVLSGPLQNLPNIINQISSATIALDRLNEVLLAEEISQWPEPAGIQYGEVEFQNCTFRWNSGAVESFGLACLNVKIEPETLAVLVGSTGSGKSSLLAALLGDMLMTAGKLRVSKVAPIAYVPQKAFIFLGTIRENVTFGEKFVQERYDRAVRAACLERDFSLMPAGDMTEIGDRGINLSGGQKQRVSMARALYHHEHAHIFLLDDPLSALDAAVAREVHERALEGMLRGKTRLLATNRLEFVSSSDMAIFLDGGTVAAHGPYQQMFQECAAFRQLMKEGGALGKQEERADPAQKPKTKEDGKKAEAAAVNEAEGKLIQKEQRVTGVVSKRVVSQYCNAIGGFGIVALIAATFITVEVCRSGASVWLSVWSTHSATMGPSEAIGIYTIINFGNLLVNLLSQLLLARQSVEGGRSLHAAMYASLIRAPMAFFDTTPLGRVLNRFTKDTTDVDKNTITMIAAFIRQSIQMISAVAIIGMTAYYSLFVFAPMFILFYFVQQYYNTSAREIKRLDALTRSPIYQEFGQCLEGMSSIRAYTKQDKVLHRCGLWIDRHMQTNVAAMSTNRWLSLRLENLGAVLVLVCAAFCVAAREVLSAGFAGLALSQALQMTGMIGAITRLWSIAEQSMNSVERLSEYAHGVPPEAPSVIENSRPPGSWPSEGRIEYRDVWASYREGLPPVLRGLTFTVEPGEKVGIVGRTGAGKSSLLLTLFRIVEAQKGTILIDGKDTSKVGLLDLRSRIGIIPQEPVIFKGTIRSNLDPFDEHEDKQLWMALEQGRLAPMLKDSKAGLSTAIEEAGSNLAVGQRQLVCLARAVLRRARIVVLDEATASVDVHTDALIQESIREVFDSCTMLTIAHRLQTIIDSDRIMVMDAGTVLECASPKELLSRRTSAFYDMVQETGKANADFLISIACGDLPRSVGRTLSQPITASRQVSSVAPALGSEGEDPFATVGASPLAAPPSDELLRSIFMSLQRAEACCEDLQATPGAVAADSLEELKRLHQRLGGMLGRFEDKLIGDVQFQS